MTLAIIVAAYRAAPWIASCLASITESIDQAHGRVEVEVRVGVDACEETAAELTGPYYWSRTNVGPYVLRNSLLRVAPADAYAVFDADDVMLPAYIPSMARKLRGYALVGPSRTECDETLTPVRFAAYRHGVCAFRHEVLERLGGYADERIGADVDFIARARSALIHPHVTTEPMYLRRRHAASLTTAAETCFGSQARREARKRMERQRMSRRGVWVRPATVPLEHRQTEALV